MDGLASAFEQLGGAHSPGEMALREGLALACDNLAVDPSLAPIITGPAPIFRAAALDLQMATDHELVIAGPAETGKTFAALWRLDTLLRETPGARAAIVRKVRADMDGTVLEMWRRIIAVRGDVQTYGGERPDFYMYGNGSRVYIGGMDRPGKVLSAERDWVYVNQTEELSLEDWEVLSTRCTGRGAVTRTPMLFGDCNPGPPTHWILQRPALRLLHSWHEDNPTLYDEAGNRTPQGERTMAILDTLTGVRKERLRDGRWAAVEGVVYEGWSRGLHLIDPFPIPPDWRRIRVVDFGYTNPFVCQWWAIDGDGRAYRYREIYYTRRLVEDHAKQILELTGTERIEATVCDHDAEDRATLERHGKGLIPTIAAAKAIRPGIQVVAARLLPAGDGKPRLFLFRDALVERDEALMATHKPVCTEQEFEVYSWPKGADGRAIKEVPVEVDNHGMDSTRYGVAYLDGLGDRSWWRDLAAKPVPETKEAHA